MSAEILHLVFAAAGLVLGYLIRNNMLPAGLQDILPALEQVLSQKKLGDAHDALQDLAAQAKSLAPKTDGAPKA
jgi:hypothetical protein